MIEVKGLVKSYGAKRAVDGVTFSVKRGDILGFLGPNGAGKTTTMRLLLGLLRPSSGSARVDGRVGYLPEAFAAYDALSVAGYLRFCCHMKRLDAGTAVPQAMDDAGIADLARRPVGRLSKGQRQRVGLAQAVLGRPPALVLDEPTASLDPRQVVDARALVRSAAAEGAAVLVSTHLLAEAAAVCDRVVVIAGGRVLADEPVTEAAELEARFLRLVAEAELT